MATMTITDATIQADVLEELEFDPEVDVTDVGIAVDDGVVTLTGTVDTYAEKMAAERAALRVAGVRALANDLIVARELVGIPTDTAIAKQIADAFALNVAVPEDVTAKVEDGRVNLHGETPWHYQREEAERVARQIAGVKSVTNTIRIIQPPVAPKAVESQIIRALVRNAAVDARGVDVAVSGGHVTLSGTVRSWAERQEAAAAARRTKGVTEVTNRITVQPPPA